MPFCSSPQDLPAAIKQELGPSEWLEIIQERIDRFAEATDDFQWIHVDTERAANGPFGSTIAQGYLTLSLVPKLVREYYRIEGAAMTHIYFIGEGFNVIELGVMNNGYTDLRAYKNADGITLPEDTLADALSNMQRQVHRQYQQGVLADMLGYDYYFLTEHHFQPEGAEHGPNPLMIEAALAVSASRIRLGQMANIVPWHHPVRLAEQAAFLA